MLQLQHTAATAAGSCAGGTACGTAAQPAHAWTAAVAAAVTPADPSFQLPACQLEHLVVQLLLLLLVLAVPLLPSMHVVPCACCTRDTEATAAPLICSSHGHSVSFCHPHHQTQVAKERL
jgi:hypothetical protein